MNVLDIPDSGRRAESLDVSVARFLTCHQGLELGGLGGYAAERQKHAETFAHHKLPKHKINPIGTVESATIPGPHGAIPVRVLYPMKGRELRTKGDAGALVYCHGGGYCTGSVDEFENSLRLIAEKSGCLVFAFDYRLAPEFRYPVQLDEYSAVVDWVQGYGGRYRGVHPRRVVGGGDGVGGSMTAALCLRRRDEGKKPLAGQLLLYPAMYSPSSPPAADENKSGYYLEYDGLTGLIDHYLPLINAVPSYRKYVYPGAQGSLHMYGQPLAVIFTNGFDPLREGGIAHARAMRRAGALAAWKHYADLTHGWLRMAPWSPAAREATCYVAVALEMFVKVKPLEK
ncbi:Alpha/Beta hydrolase protein [Chaetomium fimeti]|uniref:Alpha/Beta hydrolase protein n=1 Tax=Chaetomium fimeti TaxID=1854472 RepID=A0AAE0LQK5_9PEZI|nr:Alpha/Beta hydrolase protein [Chaetomium fimeti]